MTSVDPDRRGDTIDGILTADTSVAKPIDGHRRLPLLDLRRAILTCNRCFEGSSKACWHHEDVVGGYSPGRVIVIGVNPQATPGNRIYETIRDADWQTKSALSDRILDVFADRVAFDAIHPEWGWMKGRHRGLATWLPRVCEHFRVTSEKLADHFAFVEAFKHATRDQAALMKDPPTWARIQGECPKWLLEQLTRLRPRLLVLCGSTGKNVIAPLLFRKSDAVKLRRETVHKMHGRTKFAEIAGKRVPVVFTLAISAQTSSRWMGHVRTQAVRRAIQDAIGANSIR